MCGLRGRVWGLPSLGLAPGPTCGPVPGPRQPCPPTQRPGLLKRQRTLWVGPGREAPRAEWWPWLSAPCWEAAQRPEAAAVSLARGAAPVVTPAVHGQATGAPGGPAGLTVNLRRRPVPAEGRPGRRMPLGRWALAQAGQGGPRWAPWGQAGCWPPLPLPGVGGHPRQTQARPQGAARKPR